MDCRRFNTFSTVLLALALFALPAFANDDNWGKTDADTPVERSRPSKPHWLAIGLGTRYGDDYKNPLSLSYTLHGEWAQDPKLTFSGYVGLGYDDRYLLSLYGKGDGTDATLASVRSITIGLEGAYYLLGTFDHGVKVGGTVFAIDTHHDLGTTLYSEGSGKAGGLFVGARTILPLGLTVEGTAGAAVAFLDKFTRNPSTPAATAQEISIVPYVRASVGWAF